jgi:hypothetical protein
MPLYSDFFICFIALLIILQTSVYPHCHYYSNRLPHVQRPNRRYVILAFHSVMVLTPPSLTRLLIPTLEVNFYTFHWSVLKTSLRICQCLSVQIITTPCRPYLGNIHTYLSSQPTRPLMELLFSESLSGRIPFVMATYLNSNYTNRNSRLPTVEVGFWVIRPTKTSV